jgi:hypothetical protein
LRYLCLNTPRKVREGFVLRNHFSISRIIWGRLLSLISLCFVLGSCGISNIFNGCLGIISYRFRRSIVSNDSASGIQHIAVILLSGTHIPLAHSSEHLPIEIGYSFVLWLNSGIRISRLLLLLSWLRLIIGGACISLG